MLLRARELPRLDWGAPSDLRHLLIHITGRDYRHMAGHFFDRVFWLQVDYAIHWLPRAVGYVGLIAGVIGLALLARRASRLAILAALLALAGAVFAISYAANDVTNYLMLVVLAIGLCSSVALFALWRRAGGIAATAALAALIGATGAVNWRDCDERADTITRDFATNMLSTLPRDAIVLTREWDFWGAGSLYLQEVEGFRKDVVVVDYDLLHRDWYVDQLARAHPEVMNAVRPEMARLKAAHARVEPGRRPTRAEIAMYVEAVRALANAIIDRNVSGGRPCFLTYDPFDPGIAASYVWAPWGLAQQLVGPGTYAAESFPDYRFRMWNEHVVPQEIWTLKLYGEACLNRAIYERRSGHEDLALRYAKLAVTFDPGFRESDIPVQPGGMRDQLIDVIRRFRRAEAELASGQINPW
jgi:hypothetical protein